MLVLIYLGVGEDTWSVESCTEGLDREWRVGSRDAEQIHHLPRQPSPLHRNSAARGGREQGEGEQVSSAASAEYKYTLAHACVRSHRQLPRDEGTERLE